MLSQIHMAKTATYTFQNKLIMISDNISNAQTVGHKSSEMQLQNMFPLMVTRSISEFEDAEVTPGKRRKKFLEYGQGVRVSAITRDVSQGTIKVTNRPLDLAIQGRGYFRFRLPDGRVSFARAGNLYQNNEGTLVNASGHPLEPTIRVPRNTTEVIVNQEGRFYVQVSGDPNPREIGQLVLADFPNEEGLLSVGQNMYVESAASGEALLSQPAQNSVGGIRQRALEYSNVNIIKELMDMLMVQRTFEVTIKAVKAADKILQVGSDLK